MIGINFRFFAKILDSLLDLILIIYFLKLSTIYDFFFTYTGNIVIDIKLYETIILIEHLIT